MRARAGGPGALQAAPRCTRGSVVVVVVVLQHAGLDDAQLGPRLARLLAPDSPLPAREMVARGLAPLAGSEPWLALYQLWVRGGPTLAELASRTAGELPAAVLMTALADPHLPPVVLDMMARRRIRNPETLRLIVHHPRVHAATLGVLARAAPEMVCSAIAKNQRRWLACPAIAEQLVRNPCCDRSTAHAVLELGARESLAGLAELWRRALAGATLHDGPEAHARATAWMLRSGPHDPFPELGEIAAPGLSLRVVPGPRESTARAAGHAHADALARVSRRFQLPGPASDANDTSDALDASDDLDDLDLPIGDDWDDERDPTLALPPAPRRALVLSPPPPPAGVPRQLELPRTPSTRGAPRPETRRSHAAQVQLVLDPATPLPLAMSLLHRLRAPELRRVAAGRRLAPALVAAARRRTGSG